jgi:hypothetical protein
MVRPYCRHPTAKFSPFARGKQKDRNRATRVTVGPMNRIITALNGYALSETGASASEVALMLLIIGGCIATGLHALGAGQGRLVISLNEFLSSHVARG